MKFGFTSVEKKMYVNPTGLLRL